MQNLREISQTPNIPPLESVAEKEKKEDCLFEIIGKLPPNSNLKLYEQTWADYEDLLDAVGEASGWRISYDTGVLEIMTLSTEHENYGRLLQMMIGNLCIHLRIEIISFGSATIKKSRFEKGTEPDACFYVQTAAQIGSRKNLDFSVDPAPDVAVEIVTDCVPVWKPAATLNTGGATVVA